MTNALDSLVVGGDAIFNGGNSQLQTGVLVVHGGVYEATGTTLSFSPCCTFTTALVGGGRTISRSPTAS